MPYDVVFYTDEHKPRVLELLNRLPPEEARERGKPNGIALKGPWSIPNEDGTPSGLTGRVALTAYVGISEAPFEVQKLPPMLTLEKLADGLVVGNWRPEIWERNDIKPLLLPILEQEKRQNAIWEAQKAQLEEQFQAERMAKMIKVARKDVRVLARIAGVKKPSKRAQKRMAQRIGERAESGCEFCGMLVGRWQAIVQPPQEEPRKFTSIEDFEQEAARAMAGVVQTHERNAKR